MVAAGRPQPPLAVVVLESPIMTALVSVSSNPLLPARSSASPRIRSPVLELVRQSLAIQPGLSSSRKN